MNELICKLQRNTQISDFHSVEWTTHSSFSRIDNLFVYNQTNFFLSLEIEAIHKG